jgi:hypothetical protein
MQPKINKSKSNNIFENGRQPQFLRKGRKQNATKTMNKLGLSFAKLSSGLGFLRLLLMRLILF